MKRKNATRSALFTSIISLLLCVSMLVGTTFAWFTDEVKSGRNTIAAGNLDVELYANDDKVDGNTKLFDDVDPNLWEPGAVAYENLQVKNVGTLALQYTLTLDVLNETVVNGYKLSDVIMVGIVEGGVSGNDRNALVSSITTWTALKNFKLDQTAVKLEAGHASEVFGVVLYWRPNSNEIDNRYNMNNTNKDNTLKLDIGVSLVATQVMHENDSFSEDYDEAATPWIGAINTDWYFEDPQATEFTIDTVDELAGLAAIVNGTATAPATTFAAEGGENTVQDSFKNKTVTLGADIDLANATWTPIGNSTYKFQGTFDGASKTISNLKVTGNGSNVGLFGFTTGGEIKNLTVENASVTGRLNVGVVAGTPYTSKYTNITVKGHVEVNGMSYVGGVGGKNAYANWDNITVDVDDASYVKADSVEKGKAYRTYVGGVVGFNGEGGHSFTNITSNIDVFGSTCDIGGAFGIAHYGNKFENVTVTGDVTITNANEAADVEEMGGIAGVWNNGGSDVTFTNCKFTGTLTSNFTEGVDLSDNTITGKAYSASGNGKLIIDGKQLTTVATADALKDALAAGVTTIDANGANIGTLSYGLTQANVPEGTTVTIKNAVVSGKSYGNGVNGTIIFENCVFTNTGAYSIHFDNGTGDVVFNNCTLEGWCSFGATINSVTMNKCTIAGNGKYGMVRFYQDATLNECVIDCSNAVLDDVYPDGVSAINPDKSADDETIVVDLVNCEIKYADFEGGKSKATLPGIIKIDGAQVFESVEDLSEALKTGGNVVLTEDVATEAATTAPYGNKVGFVQNGGVLDGNGNTLSVECYGDDYGIMTSGGTIKNLTIDSGCRAIMIMSPTEDIIIDNVYVCGDILYPINTGEHATVTGIDLIVTNSTFGGWSSFAGIASASFTDCKFIEGEYGYGWPYETLVKPYVNTVFTKCEFALDGEGNAYYLDMSALETGCTVTLEGCTVNGVVVTAENCTTLFGEVELPGDGRTLADCVIFK